MKLEEEDKPRWMCLKCGRIHYWYWKEDKSGGYWHEERECDGCGWKRK